MALNKTQLENDLKTLYAAAGTGSGVSPDAFAEQMATLIDDYVKTALVTITGVTTGGESATGGLS